jgi:hypothetical protein
MNVCDSEEYCSPKDEGTTSSETPASIHQSTQHHIPEDSRLSTLLIRFFISDFRNKPFLQFESFYSTRGSTWRARYPAKISDIGRQRIQNIGFKKLFKLRIFH